MNKIKEKVSMNGNSLTHVTSLSCELKTRLQLFYTTKTSYLQLGGMY